MSFLDNIKLIASELANMSPKTQLEIIKQCKNLCLNVKDYLVEFDETTLVNITTQLENLEDEITTAEGNIQANANAIDTINNTLETIETALNNRYTKEEINTLLDSKINIQYIEVSGGSGTLTESQLTDIINGQIIMIKRVNVFYYKSAESDTIIHFERINFPSTLNEGVYHKTYERINITKLTGAWSYTNVADLDVYSKDKVDELLENAGGGLDLLWTNENPKTAIESLNILFDYTQYKGVIIEYRMGAGNTTPDQKRISETFLFMSDGDSTWNSEISHIDKDGVLWHRDINLYASGLHISNGIKYNIATSAQTTFQSNALIPQVVYGIK